MLITGVSAVHALLNLCKTQKVLGKADAQTCKPSDMFRSRGGDRGSGFPLKNLKKYRVS